MLPSSHIHAAMATARNAELTLAAHRHHGLESQRPQSAPLRSTGRMRRSLARLSLAPLRQA